MKITKINLFELIGSKRSDLSIFEIDHPYLSFNGNGIDRYRQIFTEVETDEGITGICIGGSRDVADLGKLLIGEDPVKTEYLWEKLYYSRYVRMSAMQAIATLDLALWDIKGKFTNQPVYQLLGGHFREKIPAYAAMLGYMTEPERAAEVSRYWVEQGYSAVKWYITQNEADGRDGFEKNVAVIHAVREAVGWDVDIIVDFGVSNPQRNTLPYIQKLAAAYEKLGVLWLEEPLAFDDLKSHAALRKQTSIAVALGERWYNRWQFREILESQAASIIQPDPFFAMGLTEVRKITDLASAFGVPVIPHCNESFRYSAHLAFALPERIVPMMEFGIKTNHNFQHFFQDFFEPIKGFVHLPDGPGWGTQIDWDKVNEKIDLLY